MLYLERFDGLMYFETHVQGFPLSNYRCNRGNEATCIEFWLFLSTRSIPTYDGLPITKMVCARFSRSKVLYFSRISRTKSALLIHISIEKRPRWIRVEICHPADSSQKSHNLIARISVNVFITFVHRKKPLECFLFIDF